MLTRHARRAECSRPRNMPQAALESNPGPSTYPPPGASDLSFSHDPPHPRADRPAAGDRGVQVAHGRAGAVADRFTPQPRSKEAGPAGTSSTSAGSRSTGTSRRCRVRPSDATSWSRGSMPIGRGGLRGAQDGHEPEVGRAGRRRGEWRRFELSEDRFLRELARERSLPIFDAARTGYPPGCVVVATGPERGSRRGYPCWP